MVFRQLILLQQSIKLEIENGRKDAELSQLRPLHNEVESKKHLMMELQHTLEEREEELRKMRRDLNIQKDLSAELLNVGDFSMLFIQDSCPAWTSTLKKLNNAHKSHTRMDTHTVQREMRLPTSEAGV